MKDKTDKASLLLPGKNAGRDPRACRVFCLHPSVPKLDVRRKLKHIHSCQCTDQTNQTPFPFLYATGILPNCFILPTYSSAHFLLQGV